jgi:hypothetical protein
MAKEKNHQTNGNAGDPGIVSQGNQAPAPVSVSEIPQVQEALKDLSISTLLANPQVFGYLERLASNMATARSAVPDHLRTPGDCLAIILQSAKWGMDPFAVAQKTFIISGKLGYEAQLVNAVVTSSGAVQGKFNYEWFGPWENVIGKFQWREGKNGKYQVPAWNEKDEIGCGIRVSATLTGEDTPRILELLLVQATVRNSTLWASDPKQQIAYLAVKRWARMFAPETILGVYTRDELEEVGKAPPKPITPTNTGSQSQNLVNAIKGQEDQEDPPETMQPEIIPADAKINQMNIEYIEGIAKAQKIQRSYIDQGLKVCFKIDRIDEIPVDKFEDVCNWIKSGCPAF